ncbi:uncharacterized protein LOC130806777 [Amaranthus tricolor]|uniref:uncharacterized protein LOC130806777 n=1 Tax=Amaranthus tricolor TaxID=29722 RepID=UPI00258C6DEE|nr:uncharacterized protein LOC130806777 [Amaranthus tricolor]
MASKARCFLFLILVLFFSIQINARDSKFFNKLSKEMINHESITISPIQAPILAPSPSPQSNDVEHGYGLYGQDPYENYEYPPTTTNPTKTTRFGEEKYVSTQEEFSKNNFKEFETSYSNNGNGNGNGNVNENGYGNGNGKQGMSDTRYMENGKYFYDVSHEEGENVHFKTNNYENGNLEEKKQGMSDTRFLDKEEGKSGEFLVNSNENENEFKKFENEKKGMSDTRFLENGKYYYDVNNEYKKNNEDVGFHNNNNVEYANSYYENGNGNEKNMFENFENEKKGMSDTRFLENGKYYYNVNNKNNENWEFHNNNNVEYANSYYENGNGNENNGYETQGKEGYENEYENGNGNEKNGYETQEREGYDYKHSNEFNAKEGRGRYNYPKKFPNEYDTMEEYDREQGYIDGQDHYVP